MRYLLITGGEIKDFIWMKEQISFLRPDKIIAVDSGADYLDEINLKANILLGDLDSISDKAKKYYKDNDKIIKLQPEKDDTDTGVALDLAIKDGADEVYIIPGVGCRFDHSYANILLLKKALDSNVKAYLVNENNKIFLKDKSFTLKGQEGVTASFFALFNEISITLKGFYYPLNNYKMKLDDPVGVSNKVVSSEAIVSFERGSGVVMAIIATD